ncbi:MAG: hypothetical protein AAF191_11350 [Verrucomicrobiota bacterium]
MSQLHQMQLTFVPEEDRLLFRVNTSGRQRAEFRFWMTRRYVTILWDALLNMLKNHKPGEEPEPEADPKPEELVQEHQEMVEKADFQTEYQESSVFPLGEQPILLAKVGLGSNPQGVPILSMQPQNGQGIEFSLNRHILHSFCKLLVESTQKADWKLNLDFGQAEDLMSNLGLN